MMVNDKAEMALWT